MWDLHLKLEQKREVLHDDDDDDDDDDDSWRCNVPSHVLLLTAPFLDLQNFLCFRSLRLARPDAH